MITKYYKDDIINQDKLRAYIEKFFADYGYDKGIFINDPCKFWFCLDEIINIELHKNLF